MLSSFHMQICLYTGYSLIVKLLTSNYKELYQHHKLLKSIRIGNLISLNDWSLALRVIEVVVKL